MYDFVDRSFKSSQQNHVCVRFFSPGLSEQMDMYPKNLMVNQCSASFSPSKDIVCPLNSTILRMPNSCERINQRMPHFSHQDFLFRAKFQKATEVSASDDELKVPFWEWVYSFKDLNMCIHIYIHIIIIIKIIIIIVLYYFQPMNIHMGWVQTTSKFSQEVRTFPVRSKLSGSDK